VIPLEVPPNLDDRAYLIDPEGKWGRHANPDVTTFQDHLDPLLVLLGEAGLGKSQVLRDEEAHLGVRALRFDLLDFQSPADLLSAITEHTRWKTAWSGDGWLVLLLDSLDESRLPEPVLARTLEELVSQAPHGRLRVRLACRATRRMQRLEQRLAAALDAPVTVVSLLPLRRRDVALAAEQLSVPPAAFVRAVDASRVSALAASPLTLKMLLSLYKVEGKFPTIRSAIYNRALLLLCEDPPDRRDEAREAGRLPPVSRLAVARRVAAFTMLGGFSAIDLGPTSEHDPRNGLGISEITGGVEDAGGVPVTVDEAAIREATNTGLFHTDHERCTWTHPSFAEYLAGAWLARLAPMQAYSLVERTDSIGSYIVPKLRDTVAFLVEQQPSHLSWLIGMDPELALRAGGIATDADRPRLVEVVVKTHTDWSTWVDYPKLAHPGLAAQLVAIVEDTGRLAHDRESALDIARTCHSLCPEVVRLLPVAKTISLDPTSPPTLREAAALVVAKLGPDERATLESLAHGEVGPDSRQNLRGIALRALWRHTWTDAGVLHHLPQPRDPHYHGHYADFLTAYADGTDAIPALLEHLRGWSSRHGDLAIRDAEERLLQRAWRRAAEPAIQGALVTHTLANIHAYAPGFIQDYDDVEAARNDALKDVAVRRSLVKRFLDHPSLAVDEVAELVQGSLLQPGDITWLIEHTCAGLPDRAPAWARAVRLALPPDPPAEFWTSLRAATTSNATLSSEFPVVVLDRLSGGSLARPPASARARRTTPDLCTALSAPATASQRWQQILVVLSGVYGGLPELRTPATRWAGWPQTPDLRAALADRAVEFLSAATPPEAEHPLSEWDEEIPTIAFHAAYALQCLHTLDRLDVVDSSLWAKWARSVAGIVGFAGPWFTGVLHRAYRHAPAQVRDAIGALQEPTDVLNMLDGVWDEALAALARAAMILPGIGEDDFFVLGERLLAHGDVQTRSLLRGLTETVGAFQEEGVQRLYWLPPVVDQVWHLALTRLPGGGDAAWGVLSQDAAMTRRVLAKMAQDTHLGRDTAWSLVSDRTLAAMTAWVLDEVADVPDPQGSFATDVTPIALLESNPENPPLSASGPGNP
jgi:hypothetical protein